jgi:hypothetical protein
MLFIYVYLYLFIYSFIYDSDNLRSYTISKQLLQKQVSVLWTWINYCKQRRFRIIYIYNTLPKNAPYDCTERRSFLFAVGQEIYTLLSLNNYLDLTVK